MKNQLKLIRPLELNLFIRNLENRGASWMRPQGSKGTNQHMGHSIEMDPVSATN